MMIVPTSADNGLVAEPLYCVYNPPMADNSQTNRSFNTRFSEGTALQLGSGTGLALSGTARVGSVPLDVSEYEEESPYVDLLSIDGDELLSMRRQLLQRRKRSKNPTLLEAIKSKYSIRKLFFGSAAQIPEVSPSDGLINNSLS